MTRTRVVAWLCLVLPAPLLAALANGPAEDTPRGAQTSDCAVRIARTVQAHYDAVRDLEADFEQTTQSVALGTGSLAATAHTSGRVLFAKPGKMRWHYTAPEQSLVVTDGAVLWIYDPVGKEAQRMPVTQEYLSGAALQLLIGEGDLVAEYEIASEDCAADPVRLDLVPRRSASYERLSLVADPRSGAVRETTIVDLFGNVTTVAFHKVRTNMGPAADRFEFVPPEGTRVVDLLEP